MPDGVGTAAEFDGVQRLAVFRLLPNMLHCAGENNIGSVEDCLDR